MKLKLLLITCLVVTRLHAQQGDQPYDFPIKPGTETWKNFKSAEEAYQASQIPGAILKRLSTLALVKTCLHYPLFGIINAHNSPQAGYNFLKQNFNGISELEKRSDAGIALLQVYANMHPKNIDRTWPLKRQGEYLGSFQYIEIILSQFTILKTLQPSHRATLLREAKIKCDEKQRLPDVYGSFAVGSSMLAPTRLLSLEGKLQKQTGVDKYIETGLPSSETMPLLYKAIAENQE